MKKLGIASMLIFFSFFFSSCSKPEITESTIIQTDGMYNYYKGKTNSKIKAVTLTTQNGSVETGQLDGNEFMTHSTALITDETVNILIDLENGKTIEEEVVFKKREPIDDYENFATEMNFFITSINKNAKTQSPEFQDDGTSIVSNENGVTASVNVQDGKIVGLNLTSPGDANKEMATVIVSFQTVYDANNTGVSKAYNNTLESKKENSFSSGGFLFTFSYNDDVLITDIIKE